MEVKTTNEIVTNFQLCYEGEVLKALGKRFTFDIYGLDMDGFFPNKASWTRFINRVENGELPNKLSYKRKNEYIKKIDFETIEVYSEAGFNIATGYLFDENGRTVYVYDNYKKVTLKLDYSYYYKKDIPEAYWIEIFGAIEKLEK